MTKTLKLDCEYFSGEVAPKWGYYENGKRALRFNNALSGEPMFTATVNIPGFSLKPNETFIKSWGENSGLVEELARLGWIEILGTLPTGYVLAHHCRWLASAQIPDQE